MSSIPDLLISIAHTARKLTEEFANQYKNVGHREDLCGFCAIGSMIFYKLAKKTDYPVAFVEGIYCYQGYPKYKANHCWNTYKDSIVDITATQFDLSNDNVEILSIYDERYIEQATNKTAFRTLDKWTKFQNPKTYRDHIEKITSDPFALLL